MSYDLKLTNGDIGFGPDGDFLKVTGTDKLEQDAGKIMNTIPGQDPGNSIYGSKLRALLGKAFDADTLQSLAASSVNDAINFLQSMQFVQTTYQDVSFDEMIGRLEAVAMRQVTISQIAIDVSILTVRGQRLLFSKVVGNSIQSQAGA